MNAQPGLQIQLANMEGLKSRLDRVDDLQVADAKHGVRIVKLLFAGDIRTPFKWKKESKPSERKKKFG